jgi:glutaredoxin-related protein
LNLKKILIIIIALSLIVSVLVDVNRIKVENKYDTVEIVGDLKSFKDLASATGRDLTSVLSDMKSAGLIGVAVNEVTLENLQQSGEISLSLLKDVINLYLLSSNLGNEALEDYLKSLTDKEREQYGNYIVVTTKDVKIFNFLKEALTKRVPEDGLKVLEKRGSYAFVINKPKDVFITKGLGFDESDLGLVKSLGFDVIPRIENFTGIKDKDIEEYVDILKKFNVKTVIFNGTDVLGNPEKIPYAASLFKKNDINVGIIDVPMGKKLQEGMNKFAKFDSYKGIKVFGVSEAETQKYDASEIINRWYRGMIERNVRIIYMRAKIEHFKSADYNIEQNKSMIEDMTKYIKKVGLKVGVAKPLSELHQSKLTEILISLGVIAAGLLLLQMLGIGDYVLILSGLLGAILTSLVLVSRFNDLGVKAVALASSIIFPSLGIGYFIDKMKEILDRKKNLSFTYTSLKIFINSLLISFVGALSIAAIMADSKYMLKIDYFRGVKLSFVLPLLFYVLYYIVKIYDANDWKTFMERIKEFLNIDIKVWHLVAIVIAGIIGIIYISRTGNEPIVKPTELELKFRDFLEHTLVARPRTKEFLIGDPAIILAIYAAFKNSKGWAFIMGIFASIGILSIVNTFSHIGSVLPIAIERTVIGWVLGALIGMIAVFIVDKTLKNIKREY